MWILFELTFFFLLVTPFLPISFDRKRNVYLLSNIFLASLTFFLILSGLQFKSATKLIQLPNYSFTAVFSLDNLTAIFCFLTFFLISVSLLLTWSSPKYNSTVYLLILLILEFSLIHTFTSLNLLFFFIFFEVSLVPMFLLILLWGSRQRKVHAAYSFFFYTAFGSVFLLTGLLYTYKLTQTLYIPNLAYTNIPLYEQHILWLLFFIGFAVKVPLVPFHTWLPEAHVEAPTPGSIILAGLLLKVGTFGMLRFMFPMLNGANTNLKTLAFSLALISIYHASLIATRQLDMKKIIAYSSIAHMGFVILGVFSMNIYGLIGSIFIMFSHGIVASALFFIIGCVYDRYKTRSVLDYGGLVSVMPTYITFFFLLTLTNMSFPGTSNFVGEVVVLLGLTEVNYVCSLIATFSIILTTTYSIWVFNRISFGQINNNLQGFNEISKLECFIASTFLFLIFLFGFKPGLLLDGIETIPYYYLLNI